MSDHEPILQTFNAPARGDADAIVDAALAAAEPSPLDPGTTYGFVVPAGARLEIPDLENRLATPLRKRGIYHPADVDSFEAYLARHMLDGTTVWVSSTAPYRVVAIVDDHDGDGGEPAWRQHRVELELTHTPEWLFWMRRNGSMMSQQEFAEHVEQGAGEIVVPDAASMLELAQSFHATTTAAFRQATRLASGEVRLQYDEEIKASAGTAGDMSIPSELTLGLAPFIGEERFALKARFRYRINSGKLTLGYQLDRPERAIEESLKGIRNRLLGQFANTYLGAPPQT